MKYLILFFLASLAAEDITYGIPPEWAVIKEPVVEGIRDKTLEKQFFSLIHKGDGDTLTTEERNIWIQRLIDLDPQRTLAAYKVHGTQTVHAYDFDNDGFISSLEGGVLNDTEAFKIQYKNYPDIMLKFLTEHDDYMTEDKKRAHAQNVTNGNITRIIKAIDVFRDQWKIIDLDRDGWISLLEYNVVLHTEEVQTLTIKEAWPIFMEHGIVTDARYAVWKSHRQDVGRTLVFMHHEALNEKEIAVIDNDHNGIIDGEESKLAVNTIAMHKINVIRVGIFAYYDLIPNNGIIEDVEMQRMQTDLMANSGFFTYNQQEEKKTLYQAPPPAVKNIVEPYFDETDFGDTTSDERHP